MQTCSEDCIFPNTNSNCSPVAVGADVTDRVGGLVAVMNYRLFWTVIQPKICADFLPNGCVLRQSKEHLQFVQMCHGVFNSGLILEAESWKEWS